MLNNSETSTDAAKTDVRLQQLKHWLETLLNNNKFLIKPASSDASNRRYFRVWHNHDTYIAMDAPDDKEGCDAFVKVGQALKKLTLNAPDIFNYEPEQGFMLLSDLGKHQYLSELNTKSVDALYADALNALLKMQQYAPSVGLPKFDAAQISKELDIFTESFLQDHLHININNLEKEILHKTYTVLSECIQQQPYIFMHRDYHSRNLMVCADNPGILDFQGAMHGPITYDLVSLLRDCYINWPKEKIQGWLKDYHSKLCQVKLINCELETFRRWFDLTGMQRHLKAIGLFARLNHRDNKPGYLSDIPRTFAYVMSVYEHYPELEPFAKLMHQFQISKRIEA